jgi:8-oxo-dGTP diphosphatase
LEAVDEAVQREVYEETGANIKLYGVTGLQQNLTRGIISIVFRGKYVNGALQPQEGEIKDVQFNKIDERNADRYITRPHFRNRLLAAKSGKYVPLETFKVRPYELISRLTGE